MRTAIDSREVGKPTMTWIDYFEHEVNSLLMFWAASINSVLLVRAPKLLQFFRADKFHGVATIRSLYTFHAGCIFNTLRLLRL